MEVGRRAPGSAHQTRASGGGKAAGHAVKEIAAELGLAKTDHVHRANLLEKLGVSNDVELARRMFDSWQ